MARKTVSRKKLRAEGEAAEKKATKKKAAKKKATKKATKKTTKTADAKAKKAAPKKKRTRKKKAAEVRLRLFWGVFNQSLKRVALFEFNQRKQAEKKAEDLSNSGNKSPHFVQRVKEEIDIEET